jgi:hypothetical protein
VFNSDASLGKPIASSTTTAPAAPVFAVVVTEASKSESSLKGPELFAANTDSSKPSFVFQPNTSSSNDSKPAAFGLLDKAPVPAVAAAAASSISAATPTFGQSNLITSTSNPLAPSGTSNLFAFGSTSIPSTFSTDFSFGKTNTGSINLFGGSGSSSLGVPSTTTTTTTATTALAPQNLSAQAENLNSKPRSFSGQDSPSASMDTGYMSEEKSSTIPPALNLSVPSTLLGGTANQPTFAGFSSSSVVAPAINTDLKIAPFTFGSTSQQNSSSSANIFGSNPIPTPSAPSMVGTTFGFSSTFAPTTGLPLTTPFGQSGPLNSGSSSTSNIFNTPFGGVASGTPTFGSSGTSQPAVFGSQSQPFGQQLTSQGSNSMNGSGPMASTGFNIGSTSSSAPKKKVYVKKKN